MNKFKLNDRVKFFEDFGEFGMHKLKEITGVIIKVESDHMIIRTNGNEPKLNYNDINLYADEDFFKEHKVQLA